jgi:hypothetical protein
MTFGSDREVKNECDARPGDGWGYERAVLEPGRVQELIALAGRERDGHSYPAGTSFTGGTVPADNVLAAADFALLHGNGVSDLWRIGEMAEKTRAQPSFTPSTAAPGERIPIRVRPGGSASGPSVLPYR